MRRQVVLPGVFLAFLDLDKFGFRAYRTGMKFSTPSMFACSVLVAACLVWVGGISLAITYFLGLSWNAGWWIAGSLGVSFSIAVTVILHEMRHAVDLSEMEEPAGVQRLPSASQRGPLLGSSSRPETLASSFRVRH